VADDPFSYTLDFAQTVEDLHARFQRTFVHRPWTDGVDVIQAERNGAEEGFNARFKKIEDDLDSLARDAKTSIDQLISIRQDLFELLDDIKVYFGKLLRPVPGGWVSPGMPNGWASLGTVFNQPGYFRDRSWIVHLRGFIRPTTVPLDSNPTLFQLDAGHRPESIVVLGAFGGASMVRVEITPAGSVNIRSRVSEFLSLDGLHFRAVAPPA
jgi:hypothetical protein